MLTASNLSALRGLRHGFLTRRGGVSTGLYSSLNTGFGADDPRENVLENRRRALHRIGADSACLVTGEQTHSTTVHIVQDSTESPRADALVTNQPQIALGVLTADCGPVLFAEPDARIIGTAHAGWQGAFGGICAATVATMEQLGAKRARIQVAVGPCIAQQSYEVGSEFFARFCGDSTDNAAFFLPSTRENHHLFDLRGYIRDGLGKAGLESIEILQNDSYREEDLFFSWRRSCHRNEADYGRGLSVICLDQ